MKVKKPAQTQSEHRFDFALSRRESRLSITWVSRLGCQPFAFYHIKGTLRGLHYQLHRPQAKLCRVVEGEALDVAECIHDPKVCERRFVICLDEEATRVAMDNPSQIKHARKGCLDSLH